MLFLLFNSSFQPFNNIPWNSIPTDDVYAHLSVAQRALESGTGRPES